MYVAQAGLEEFRTGQLWTSDILVSNCAERYFCGRRNPSPTALPAGSTELQQEFGKVNM